MKPLETLRIHQQLQIVDGEDDDVAEENVYYRDGALSKLNRLTSQSSPIEMTNVKQTNERLRKRAILKGTNVSDSSKEATATKSKSTSRVISKSKLKQRK